MEKLLFICPKCKAHETINANKDTVTCSKCDMTFKYTDQGFLEGIKYKTVKELSDWQKARVERDVAKGRATFTMTPENIICGNTTISLEDVSDLAMHGQNALVFSVGKDYYEAITPEDTNALKFMLYYQVIEKKSLTEAVK